MNNENQFKISQDLWHVRMVHHRFMPKKYFFKNSFYWLGFSINKFLETKLNKNELHCKKENSADPLNISSYVSRNKFSFFSFEERDYLPKGKLSLLDDLIEFACLHWPAVAVKDIYLMTSINVLGHSFNPLCFFFFISEDGKWHAMAHVTNTFYEMKRYPLYWDEKKQLFETSIAKDFYVSPFIEHDAIFKYSVSHPLEEKKFKATIETWKNSSLILKATLVANKEPLTFYSLIRSFFKDPLHPWKVLLFIHWHALRLWLKKIYFFKKNQYLQLQRGEPTWKTK